MRIEKIEGQNINQPFKVYLKPNWIEKLFGVKKKVKIIVTLGDTYFLGGGFVYFDQNGRKLGNGHWIANAIGRHLDLIRLKNSCKITKY